MADAAPNGFDFSQMGPALAGAMPAIMAAISAGQTPAGSSGYTPRQSLPNGGMPAWFSMGSMLSQYGAAFGGAGSSADLFMGVTLPNLMSRMQANAGVDGTDLYTQRAMMQARMDVNYTGMGQSIATSLGMDPNSWLGQHAGIIPLLMPQLRSAAYAIDPTASYTGGESVIQTLQLLDPMSQLKPGQATALRETMTRLGTNGAMMASMFTHGGNMDDLFQAGVFAADMHVTAQDLDVDRMRAASSAAWMKKSNKREDLLTDDDRAQREADVTQDVAYQRLTTAGSYNLQAARAAASMLGNGAGINEGLNYLSQRGVAASTQGEADTLEKVIRQLKALGEQAHVSTQDIMNAGRAMAAQTGGIGGEVYNGYAFANAKSAIWAMQEANKADGVVGNIKMADVALKQIGENNLRQEGSMRQHALLAIAGSSTDLKQRVVDLINSGDTRGLSAMIDNVVHPNGDPRYLQATAALNMGADTANAIRDDLSNLTGAKFNATYQGVDAQYMLKHMTSDPHLLAILSDSKNQEQIAKGLMAGVPIDQVYEGIASGETLTQLEFLRNRSGSGHSFFNDIKAMYQQGARDAGVDAMATRDTQFEIRNEVNKSLGAGQGLFQNWRAGNITGLESAAVAMGFGRPADEVKFLNTFGNMTNAEKRNFVDTVRSKQAAINKLRSANLSETDKQAAEAKLADAQDLLDPMGLNELGQNADSKQVQAWIRDAKKIAADKQKAAAAKQAAAAGTVPSSDTPKGGTDGANSATTKVDVSGAVVITVVDQHGQSLPDKDYSVEATKNPGNIHLVKGSGRPK